MCLCVNIRLHVLPIGLCMCVYLSNYEDFCLLNCVCVCTHVRIVLLRGVNTDAQSESLSGVNTDTQSESLSDPDTVHYLSPTSRFPPSQQGNHLQHGGERCVLLPLQ